MARYKGHQGAVEVGAAVVGEVESFDIELTTAELEANTMGSDWTDVEAGQASGSGSINVLRDPADTGQIALANGAIVTLTLYPEGDTTGLTKVSGSFLVTSVGISTAVGSLVKTAYSVKNKGTVTMTAVA